MPPHSAHMIGKQALSCSEMRISYGLHPHQPGKLNRKSRTCFEEPSAEHNAETEPRGVAHGRLGQNAVGSRSERYLFIGVDGGKQRVSEAAYRCIG